MLKHQGQEFLTIREFEKYDVVTTRRCGSTSLRFMNDAFSMSYEEQAGQWSPNPTKKLAVILRDPVDRYWSGVKRIGHLEESKEHIFHWHTAPWLHHIKDWDFEIIPFERLGDYMDEFHGKESVADQPKPKVEDWWPVKPEDCLEDRKLYEDYILNRPILPKQNIKEL